MKHWTEYKTGDVICGEHGTKLDDPDLIDAIVTASRESPCGTAVIRDWSKLPREEQVNLQVTWVEPMPFRAQNRA